MKVKTSICNNKYARALDGKTISAKDAAHDYRLPVCAHKQRYPLVATPSRYFKATDARTAYEHNLRIIYCITLIRSTRSMRADENLCSATCPGHNALNSKRGGSAVIIRVKK